jgi:opacity protein-like surface antigen
LRLPIFALAVLALGLPLTARAVDLPPAPVLDDDEETLGSGWYLRGDVGGLDQMVSRRSRDRGLNGLSSLVNGKLDRAATVGAGIGYQISPWFRTDVTIDHRFEAAFRGARMGRDGTYALDRANFDATTFLVNAYVDLPFWNGITPYFGAGIGASRAHFDRYESSVVAPSGAIDLLAFSAHSETLLAWALMGGVAFDLTAQFKIDLGYRYSRLDGDDFDRSTAPVRPRNIGAHEFRLGARYMFE